MMSEKSKIILENQNAILHLDLYGGALSSFTLKEDGLNPLNFRLQKSLQEQNFYTGHFICLPRWGEASPSDSRKIKHGNFSELNWELKTADERNASISVFSDIESISVDREICLDSAQPLFQVRERIKNHTDQTLNYNFVQHPTIAEPFLDEQLILNFNSPGKGYRYINDFRDIENFSISPATGNKIGELFRNPTGAGLYCFPVSHECEYGWITAYSPRFNLLLGYIWPRKLYPWINIWIHYAADSLKYCGLEFGTTALHFSCEEILEQGRTQFAELPAVHELPAGSTHEFSYTGFLLKPEAPFSGMDFVHQNKSKIIWRQKDQLVENVIETELIKDYGLD